MGSQQPDIKALLSQFGPNAKALEDLLNAAVTPLQQENADLRAKLTHLERQRQLPPQPPASNPLSTTPLSNLLRSICCPLGP